MDKVISAAIIKLGRTIRQRIADFLELGDEAARAAAERAVRDAAALRARLGAGLAARESLRREQVESAAESAALAGKAEAAIGLGENELAAAAIRRKADLDARAAEIARDLSRIELETAALESRLQKLGGASTAPLLAAALKELDALIAAAAGKEREQ